MAVIEVAPDFPKAEFEQRYERARELMARDELAALFVTSPMNYIYFTGHRSDQITDQKLRPFVFLLPRDGEPLCFVMPFETKNIARTTWLVDQVRSYAMFKHNDTIVEGLREAGLERARIGCELGREQHLGMSYLDFHNLQGRLPDATFADGSSVVLETRATKSASEIERIREAARLTAEGIGQVVPGIAAGMTDVEIRQRVRLATIAAGAERVPSVHVTIGHDFVVESTGSGVVRAGDTVTIDTSAEFEGYMSDVTRTVVFGEATAQQLELYDAVIGLNHVCYEAFRPGRKCLDVTVACQQELERIGRTGRKSVGRIGHGVGCEYLEYPSLAASEDVVLEEGMVFACNPNFMTEHGFFNVEENLAVTATGYEILSEPMGARSLEVVA